MDKSNKIVDYVVTVSVLVVIDYDNYDILVVIDYADLQKICTFENF